jgi:hypothetical protein
MNAETIADIVKGRWVDLRDGASWCEIDEPHIYCCVRAEAILHTNATGMLFRVNGHTYEVCMVDRVACVEDEDWFLIYTHPTDPDIDAMTEEEWHDLYGDTKLATGSGSDSGDDRSSCHDLRIPGQVESG